MESGHAGEAAGPQEAGPGIKGGLGRGQKSRREAIEGDAVRMGGPEVRLGSREARARVPGQHSRQKGALRGPCCPVLLSPQPGFCVESKKGWGWPVLPARTARHLREV